MAQIIAYLAIPLQPVKLCEKLMIQAATIPAVAALFLTLYERYDQERITVSFISMYFKDRFYIAFYL